VIGTAIDTSGNAGSAERGLRVFDPTDTSPPFVAINSPSPSSVVSYLTDVIGTVTDDNLEFYRVQISPVSSNQWRTINEMTFQPGPGGSGVTNDLLGVFDPTLLSNTIYDVRLFAQDTNGLQSTTMINLAVEAQAKIGNFVQPVNDLTIPVAGGPPIDVTRTTRCPPTNPGVSGTVGSTACSNHVSGKRLQ
jgi:hypothetical protein